MFLFIRWVKCLLLKCLSKIDHGYLPFSNTEIFEFRRSCEATHAEISITSTSQCSTSLFLQSQVTHFLRGGMKLSLSSSTSNYCEKYMEGDKSLSCSLFSLLQAFMFCLFKNHILLPIFIFMSKQPSTIDKIYHHNFQLLSTDKCEI